MSVITLPETDTSIQPSRDALAELLSHYQQYPFAVRFWDGSLWQPHPGTPAFTIVLTHPGSVRAMFWPPAALTLSRAYVYGDYDVEGDMHAYYTLCDSLLARKDTLTPHQRMLLASKIWDLPQVDRAREGLQAAQLHGEVHSRERDQQAISYHYDLSNEVFACVLDSHMQYTTGVFASQDEDLEAGQQRKLDMICRKLRLQRGDRLLDIGCGWGGLAIFAAKHYGARVVGVTLSQRQAEWARERIREAGLERQCTIELTDYRDLIQGESFDKISVIEVTEHFGAAQFPVFFRKCRELLRPGGSMLIQQITATENAERKVTYTTAREFSQNFVFPDGQLVSVTHTLREAEREDFEVRDVECFREHYPIALRWWLENLERNRDRVLASSDEATYRVFRLYFAGARVGFETNLYGLYQTLLVKPIGTESGYPLM